MATYQNNRFILFCKLVFIFAACIAQQLSVFPCYAFRAILNHKTRETGANQHNIENEYTAYINEGVRQAGCKKSCRNDDYQRSKHFRIPVSFSPNKINWIAYQDHKRYEAGDASCAQYVKIDAVSLVVV